MIITAVTTVEERFGRCDVLVNNAGIATTIPPGPLFDLSVEEWRRVFDVNVFGIFRCVKAAAPLMIRHGGGRIVNIGSAAAFKGVPLLLHYVSSKGAVWSMTKSLAKELGERNILVNAVAPGFTISPSVRANPGQMETTRAGSLHGRAIPRDQYLEDVVGAVLFFASEDSAFVTGQTLVVDGGTYLH